MSKKISKKLSEEELIETIVKREKIEKRLYVFCRYPLIIGMVGGIIFVLVGMRALGLLFLVVCSLGAATLFLDDAHRNKTKSLVNEQLSDFYESEMQKAFGPRMKSGNMNVNRDLLKKLDLTDKPWTGFEVWRYYESDYHGIHFSISNVTLFEDVREGDNGNVRKFKFGGFVLRCKDICDPTLDLFLRKDGANLSARTWDGMPADHLVTPQMRELIQKLESFGNKYQVIRLLFRDGEAILVASGYAFAVNLPDDISLRNLDEIRKRFKDSLVPAVGMIAALRDSGGKL